jgi:hypothetical protein
VVQTCVQPSDRYLFRHAKNGIRRLKPLAITSHLAAICAIPGWSEALATQVTDEVLKASKAMTKKKSEQRAEGTLKMKPGKYVIVKIPGEGYSGFGREWCEDVRKRHLETATQSGTALAYPESIDTMIIRCPTCNFPREAMGKVTLLKGLAFKLIVCPACKMAKQSSQWLCACGVRWHICALHMQHGHSCKAKERCPRGQKAKRAARLSRREEARHGNEGLPQGNVQPWDSGTQQHGDLQVSGTGPTDDAAIPSNIHKDREESQANHPTDPRSERFFKRRKRDIDGHQQDLINPVFPFQPANDSDQHSNPTSEPSHKKAARKAEKTSRRCAKRARRESRLALLPADRPDTPGARGSCEVEVHTAAPQVVIDLSDEDHPTPHLHGTPLQADDSSVEFGEGDIWDPRDPQPQTGIKRSGSPRGGCHKRNPLSTPRPRPALERLGPTPVVDGEHSRRVLSRTGGAICPPFFPSLGGSPPASSTLGGERGPAQAGALDPAVFRRAAH